MPRAIVPVSWQIRVLQWCLEAVPARYSTSNIKQNVHSETPGRCLNVGVEVACMAELGCVRMERSPMVCHVRCMARAGSPYEIPGTTMISACVVHRSDGGAHALLWGEYRRSK